MVGASLGTMSGCHLPHENPKISPSSACKSRMTLGHENGTQTRIQAEIIEGPKACTMLHVGTSIAIK